MTRKSFPGSDLVVLLHFIMMHSHSVAPSQTFTGGGTPNERLHCIDGATLASSAPYFLCGFDKLLSVSVFPLPHLQNDERL